MQSERSISRRALLRGAAAAGIGTSISRIATAKSAAHGNESWRSLHRFRLGSMRVCVIDDARFTFPAQAFAANQPQGTIEPFLARFGLPTDSVSLHMQLTLVESGAHKVLIDTGMGDVTFPGNDVDNGRLEYGLAALGLKPADITAVIISHGHPDHIGSCSRKGKPAFKNATYYMPPSELEFWTQRPDSDDDFMNFMLGVGNAQLEPIRELIKPYADGDEIVPGITAISAPGHTLGHHAFLLHDGDAKLLHMIDTAVHYLVGVEEPDWALGVEMNPEEALLTRRSLFAKAANEKVLVAGYHFPFPGIGRIVERDSSWRFVPIQTA
ncbi:MAG: MBL fold metallo-hydrolase [Granulosicoccus sp.]|nr:MBL fold metallo-hydrolase [Granulosicoccus sp.]